VRLNFVHLKLLEKNIGFLALVEEAVVKWVVDNFMCIKSDEDCKMVEDCNIVDGDIVVVNSIL
jgi:hypothetical protein